MTTRFKKKAKFRLENIDASEVSLVPKAANRQEFLLLKMEEPSMADLEDAQQFEEEILKADLEEALSTEIEDEEAVINELVEKESLSERAKSIAKGVLRLFGAFGDDVPKTILQKLAENQPAESEDSTTESDKEVTLMADEKTAPVEEEVKKDEPQEEQTPKSEEVEKAKVAKQPPKPPEDEEEEDGDGKKKKKLPPFMKKADEASEDVQVSKADYDKLAEETAAIRKEQEETKKELEAERKARATEKAIAKAAEDYPNLPVKADELGPMVEAVNEALTKEQAETFERILKAADEAIAATKAFEEAKGGTFQLTEAGSAYARLKEIAKSYVEKAENGSMSSAQAFTKAAEDNPQLYDEYLAETRG